MSKSKIEGFAWAMRTVREFVCPGSSARSFARIVNRPKTYCGWESAGHAPDKSVYIECLRRAPRPELAEELATWAYAGEARGPFPFTPGGATVPNVSHGVPATPLIVGTAGRARSSVDVQAILAAVRDGTITSRDAEAAIRVAYTLAGARRTCSSATHDTAKAA